MIARKQGRHFVCVAAGVLAIILSFALPAQSQTVLIDFGNNQSYRGTNVANPDEKGHYWNSVTTLYYANLLTTNGTAGSWAFGFESTNPVNGAGPTDSYNGPAGDTSVPGGNITGCVFNATALGDLGITNAVYDFYVNSRFQIQALDPTKTYTLTFFGSHQYSDSDYTVYSIFTNTTYSMLETSVTLFVQNPADPAAHNQDTVATVSGVKPASDGILYIQFLGTNSGSVVGGGTGGYLNCLKITQDGSGGNTNSPASDPPEKTVLLDFGNYDSYGGTNAPNPDAQGHRWNSLHYQYVPVLTNAAGGVTALSYGLDALTGTDSYNGPAGTSSNPADCVINTNALGYLGINEAVFDYFVTAAFQIQGADPNKKYKLTFFGSHKYPDDEKTTYSLCNSSYTPLISTNLLVGSDFDHNQDTTAVISNVSPQADGTFYVRFEGHTNQLTGYLNCMSLVDLSTNVVVLPPPVAKTILVDFGNNNTYRGTNTASPDIQGHYWNSVGSTNDFTPATRILTNAAGTATSVEFAFDSAFTNAASGFGTDSYNGPAGPVPPGTPDTVLIDTNALGYLGIKPAAFDFYVNAKFQLKGMDPAKTYTLTFFGSHKYNIDNTTTYSICSDGTYGTVLASTNLVVGVSSSHNQEKVATIGPISPQPNGTMYIKFNGSAGSLGYLNCLQIVDLSSTNAPTDPFVTWQNQYFGSTNSANALAGADPDADGMSNTNEFLAGFNPTNNAAYVHVTNLAKSNNNLVVTYLGANGNSTTTPPSTSRTNVLEFTSGTANGSYSNNFVSAGQTNILSGGTGLGTLASFIETNVTTGATRYYRVRVLVP